MAKSNYRLRSRFQNVRTEFGEKQPNTVKTRAWEGFDMYRQYENPYVLEKQLEKLKAEYCTAVNNDADEETLSSLQMNIAELEERINFAWQDDEHEAE